MTIKIHCQGCGRTEEARHAKGKIKPVSLTVMGDRSWDNGTKYQEDLCPDCVAAIASSYFGVAKIGEFPKLLMPVAGE